MLIELMVVAAVAMVLAVWTGREWADRVRVLQARSLATWMEAARDAVQGYLDQEGSRSLREGTGGPGTQLVDVPGWDALKSLGVLHAGWQMRGPMGQSLGVVAWRDGGCAEAACPLRALVHTLSPLENGRQVPDEGLVAEWLMAAQGRGLVLWPHRPDAFSGAGQHVLFPSGSGPWVPGMVALLVAHNGSPGPGGTSSSGDTGDFLRVRDARDPDFQGNLSVQGPIRSDRQLIARESVVLEEGWDAGAVCEAEGALGRDRSFPGVVLCRQGKWELIARASGGGYLINSRRGCRNSLGTTTANPYTGGCFCPFGFNTLQVSESGASASADGLTSGYLCVPN
ncbi:MAG TPA: hypothetical protein VF285_02640 [Castellaniella sp.]|uniref:hypothetical protein n=1 Tax=Castellaniella sp. TaxID=1955812 RepID=UPI002F1BA7F9